MKRLLSVALISLLAAGCAQTSKTAQADKPAVLDKAAAEKAAIAKAAAANVAADPTLIPFEKMSAKLTPVTEAQLLAILPTVKAGKTVLVRGHCYRKDIGNAKAAAQARAVAVKNFLVESGVPAHKIALRYDTERSLHAVRIEVNG